MSHPSIHEARDANFKDVVLNEKGRPVLVDFWAEWCPPCITLGRTLEGLADEFGQGVKLVKVDVEASPDTAASFASRSIPHLVVFKDGRVIDQMIGNPGPARLRTFLAKHAGI